jgi:hypothetical protein
MTARWQATGAKRAVRVRAILSSNLKLICPVQPGAEKYSASPFPQITRKTPAIPS